MRVRILILFGLALLELAGPGATVAHLLEQAAMFAPIRPGECYLRLGSRRLSLPLSRYRLRATRP